MNKEYNNHPASSNSSSVGNFDIRNYLDYEISGSSGRAICPHCDPIYNNNKKTLSITLSGQYEGAYHCFRCQDTEGIRNALGMPKGKIIPTALAQPIKPKEKKSPQKYLVNNETVMEDCLALIDGSSGQAFSALRWLKARGILPEIAREYKLGLTRALYDKQKYWSISIPIPDGDKFHRKKRLIPWEKDHSVQKKRPWSQAGIPSMVYFTHNPTQAEQTWLCEGEWDAIMLGWLVKHWQPESIAVATFTSGASTVPSCSELKKLPGIVKIFYDRNDKLNFLTGKKPAEEGAKKIAVALKGRGRIAQVPMPENCTQTGWDVSDALNNGYGFDAFNLAADLAKPYIEERVETKTKNSSNSKIKTLFKTMDEAPEFIDWTVYGLLAPGELSFLAAPPRAGKSLMCLSLAKAVVSGSEFLGRPAKKGKVLYINLEDSPTKLRIRCMAQGWTEEEALAVDHLDEFDLSQLDFLREAIQENKYSLVIIDTLSGARNDDYNESSSDMAKVLKPLQNLAAKEKCAILIVHHTRKNGSGTNDPEEVFNSVRGSGAIRSTCRGMMVLVKGKEKTRLVVENGFINDEDLALRLNPTNLTFGLIGKWQINVAMGQKDQVTKYLESVKCASIQEISDNTLIQKSSLYKVLLRLVSEGQIDRFGDNEVVQYYLKKIPLTSQDLSGDCQDWSERDTEDLTKKQKISKTEGESGHQRNGLLSSCPLSPVSTKNSQKRDICQDSGHGYVGQGLESPDNPLTNSTLSGVSGEQVDTGSWSLNQSRVHFGDTTRNFNEKVDTASEDKGLEDVYTRRQDCTNKILVGVRTIEHGYCRIVREKRDYVTVRLSGQQAKYGFNVPWSEITEYYYQRKNPSSIDNG